MRREACPSHCRRRLACLWCAFGPPRAPVAQLDRALPSEGRSHSVRILSGAPFPLKGLVAPRLPPRVSISVTCHRYAVMPALPGQLELPLAAAPTPVRGHGLRAAHPRPLVSMGKGADHYSSFRTSPAKAWRFPEVEYGNAGSSIAALVLDCDKPARLRRGLPDLPPPNWTVWRRGNHHAHVCWTLDTPVHRYPAARVEPLRYLADIADYYSHAVGADPGYAGVLAHNPALIDRSPYQTTWGREDPYTLDQLASVIPFNWEPPTVRQTDVGAELRLVRSRDAMGWPEDQCSPRRAPGTHGGQSGVRSPVALL